jgi:hypothetical protein
MIVPDFWAEARVQRREAKRQITVRRFGWSETSQAEAQANAELRAQEAMARIAAGEKLARREPRTAYNGAAGVPIREEVLERHGETVITRNGYGARCLNTPKVLFVDIDFDTPAGCRATLWIASCLALVAVVAGWRLHHLNLVVPGVIAALFAGHGLALLLRRVRVLIGGGVERIARRRIESFAASHPGWRLRLYRTPAGLRVLALHRLFDPAEPAVAECFAALGADPMFVRMCLNQHCFRARLSPKPWRIGIGDHLRPRPGVWPVKPERLPERQSWVERYDRASSGHAACRYLDTLGGGPVHPEAAVVQQLHDLACRAESTLPLA